MNKLQIAPDLALPLETVTRKLAFLATTGGGKTYAASKLAELMLAASAQIIVLDTVGNWYGLRLDHSGKRPSGFELPVFGGLHADLPLKPEAGILLADLVFERNLSAIFDLSMLRKGARDRFAIDWAEQFFHRMKERPHPVHIFIEEAQRLIPQQTGKGGEKGAAARLLGAFEDLVRIGRNYGIGTSLISQRPQSIHKEVLNLTQLLFAGQTTGPHERKAIAGWIEEQGLDEDIDAILPKLAVGTFRVWSPAWLKLHSTVKIARKLTYDASATPVFGADHRVGKLTPIDVEKLKQDLAEVIEQAKADDPKELRKRVAELEHKLRVKESEKPPPAKAERVEVPVLKDAQLQRVEKLVEKFKARSDELSALAKEISAAWLEVTVATKKLEAPPNALEIVIPNPHSQRFIPRLHGDFGDGSAKASERTAQKLATNGHLPKIQQEMLDGLAFLHSLGVEQPTRVNLAVIIGKSSDGGYFTNNLSALRSLGLIDYPREGLLSLTQAGRALASDADAPRTLKELHQRWYTKLPKLQREMLEAMIATYPQECGRGDLADALGKDADGGYFTNNLSALRSLGLVEYPYPGGVKATELLFPEGLKH